ncbi:hypothetical protein [Photorhabdus khanii]|uniref:Uncharacterized protein n=1 Tax=Photorhabdus khanii subsp. guanajuatensis TaxID=2100166 RepID=A0A4R4K538_9GAMM|nr:hypothetical protein [Photorhabdus khanii]TDB61742.1 hypothetical protein C5467_04495 [Photorhabdus khanii subsp. guanajuatensis]
MIMKIISILMKIVMHLIQGLAVSVGTISTGGLIYFTLMSTLENRYQYAIVAGTCLAFSAFIFYITEKIKEKCQLFQ